MPFGVYEIEEAPKLPEDREARIRTLFRIHAMFTEQYGVRYREINDILKATREWAMDDPAPGEAVGSARTNIAVQVEQVRTDTVLFFKVNLAQCEFLLNELVPGVFPGEDDDDGPTQSVDPDELFQLGAAIAALGAAITAGGGAPVGVPVAAFGAGFMAGVAIGGMIWE